MRQWVYFLAGITFAVAGWNFGQFLLTEVGWRGIFSTELIMLPCIALWLAAGIVITEIMLSNPTRPLLNLRIAFDPILIALGLGLVVGLFVGGCCYIINLPGTRSLLQLKDADVRTISWVLVGITVAISETFAWWWRTLEAKDAKRFYTRLVVSITASLLAGLLASTLFEWLRAIKVLQTIKKFEDPIGLILLGACLGLAFGFSTSPSYIGTLRAGAGFEYTGDEEIKAKLNKLTLIGKYKPTQIEEGMSIKLPHQGEISIGSEANANIWLARVPHQVATLKLAQRETMLYPNKENYNKIYINGYPLLYNEQVRLTHNTILTFYCEDGINYYRFVYYNRFLDPLA